MKKVFIIHGWGGTPIEDWLVWVKDNLKIFEVFIPEMPDTWHPKILDWVSKLKEIVKNPDENTYFIGHSIGCQAIIRYLEQLQAGQKIGGVIFVAGWFNLTDETWDETYTKEIADQWINTPIDFGKVKQHSDRFILINSDSDPYVPLSDTDLFRDNLGAKVIILNNMGHISGEDGVKELPVVLDSLLEISK